MEKLRKIYGNHIGSGYTSDPLTQKFLETNAKKHENEGIFRKSWITYKRANVALSQKKLGDF